MDSDHFMINSSFSCNILNLKIISFKLNCGTQEIQLSASYWDAPLACDMFYTSVDVIL